VDFINVDGANNKAFQFSLNSWPNADSAELRNLTVVQKMFPDLGSILVG
jgi:ribosomal 50S subunit-associated protein YjgA (DUF615 family)